MEPLEPQASTVLSVENQTTSTADIVDFQELACEIVKQAWLDAFSSKRPVALAALAFALSRDYDIWAELAGLSDETRERIRVDIEERAAKAARARRAYAEVRAGR